MSVELPAEKLRRTCDPQSLGCTTTEELTPIEGIIGQKRALRALQFGLDIKEPGFNIYVAGVPGTGRTTAVKNFLDQLAKDKYVPSDWCYVNNFRDQYRPKAIKLLAGSGKRFQADVKQLIDEVRQAIRRAFESDQYAARREATMEAFNKEREAVFTQLGEKAQAQGFMLQGSPVGLLIIPMANGKPLGDQEFLSMSSETREEIMKRREALEAELRNNMRQLRNRERETNEILQKLDREIALFAVGPLVNEVIDKYKEISDVTNYLNELQNDILENLAQFRQEPEAQVPTAAAAPWMKELAFRKYEVSVVVDNSDLKGAPVVLERNPNYSNLFGRIEKEAQFGAFTTDFTLIRGGTLHQANGGYMVLHVEDLLTNPFSWDGIKRAIRNREIRIEEPWERYGFLVTKSLMPDPIPLEAKVIIIGNPMLYQYLWSMDEDFKEIFKVKADFDTRMDRTDENMRYYASIVTTMCCRENLRPFDSSAIAKIVEYGSRLVEDQEKLSTRFADIGDVLREASYWAGKEGSDNVHGTHVMKAIDEKIYRSNLIEERIREMMERDIFKINTEGEIVGQVNGLAVVGFGDYAFGRPNRITVSIGVGREGLVDIEREAKLAGRIYSKGVLILSGYLTQKYAQDKPLALSARLVFEQSYEEIEGDSASSTELYALLSQLSGFPIRQGVAVTGSLNQQGEVQAIGGVNEKIEGFFGLCKAKGLTGQQGVMIPYSNAKHLMLKEEVVDAVRGGKFHIYAVRTIDEGIEVLTGVRAGDKKPDGGFEEGTVNDRVDKRLRQIARDLRQFQKEEKEEAEKKEAKEDKGEDKNENRDDKH